MQSISDANALESEDIADVRVALESVLCTDELNQRPKRPPDYESENRALVKLAQALADSPGTILQTLADTILETLKSESAGISLVTEDGERFYWPAISGAWKSHIGGGTPRNFGPCGDVLDRNIPLMFSHFQRRYTYFKPVQPQVEEAILVPFHIGGKAVGTIWAVAHTVRRRFDAEDMRQLENLGRFASAAYQAVLSMNGSEQEGKALRETERRFREMIDVLPAAIYTTDAQGRLTHFNPACVEFSGRTPQLGSDHWCVTWKLYYPDGTPMPHDACPMAIALKEGRVIQGAEAIAERPDGTRVWFEPYPTTLRDETGKIIGGINMLVDITARKRAEQAKSSLAAIVESSDDAIVTKDVQGIITSWNASAERLFGYTASEAVGQPITMLIPPERVNEEPDILDRIRRGERIDHYETIRRRKDGTLRHISLTVSPVFDASGKIVGASKVARDITERKLAEEALRGSEERYRTLFELGPVAVYSCDASGTIQTFNRRAADLWGRAPARGDTDERFCGSFKMFRPDGTFMPHERCPMADVLSGAVPFVHDAEVHIERPDGSRAVVIVTIRPLKNQRGEITGAINCFYDITERKRAEEELREAKQQAEAASRAKDMFLAVLSHELRTPLAPVFMTLTALELKPDLPPDMRADVTMMRRNVELEIKLIDDLLDISRITTGKLRLQFERLDINEIIRHVCETCRPNMLEKGIHLHCDLDANDAPVVGDPARLQQVFWNLLNNAAKFTPESGDIHITSRSIDDDGQGGWVRVTVRDTGMGIASEILPRIFDAFEQGELRITRQFGGIGLGLAISKLLVERHGGSIRAESEGPNKGATFTVEMPALSLEESAPIPSQPDPNKGASAVPLRLMVVEDHADTAAVLGRLLSASGHVVKTATTAAAALALAGAHRFDVVISDLGLPDMTGYDLIKQLKAQYGIKGIAMSGYGMEEDIKRGEQAGFSAHLVKPVNFARLEASIRQVAAKGNGDPAR